MASNLPDYYLNVIGKYAVFEGRASRKEYWMFILTNAIVSITIGVTVAAISTVAAVNLMFLSTLYTLAVFLPSLGVSIRRLHDINRSGWWVLLGLIPLVGSIALIVMHCLPSNAGENQYGSRPMEIGRDDHDPEVMGELAENQLEESVRKLKEATVANLTSEKNLEAQLRKKTEEVENWSKRASTAVQTGEEDIARQCLLKKAEVSAVVEALTSQLQAQKEATAIVKAKYEEMQQQLREFRMKKTELAARYKASQAQTNSQQSSASTNGDDAFDKWEQKVRMKEALSEANREVSAFDQDAKLKQLTKQDDLENELAELKRKVAGT